MAVKATLTKNVYTFMYPTKDWKDFELKDMKAKDFRVATDRYYIAVRRE
jgi:hypothetical protein